MVVADVAVGDLKPARHAEGAQTQGRLRVAHHPAADKRHLAFKLIGHVHQDLHPEDGRGERRHDDLARRAAENFLEPGDDIAIGAGDARGVGVGAVAKQGEHALRAKLGEPVKIEALSIQGRLIDLEVARVDDHALWRVDGERHRVGNAVGDAQELDREWPDLDALSWRDRNQTALVVHAMFVELGRDHGECERRPVDRAVEVGHHIRHGADVVLVTVRENEGRDAAFVHVERCNIRDHQIDPEEFRLWKHDTGVHQQGRIPAGDEHHVHAELTEAPDWDDLDGRRADSSTLSRHHRQRPSISRSDTSPLTSGSSRRKRQDHDAGASFNQSMCPTCGSLGRPGKQAGIQAEL